MGKLRILLADDHKIMREGLRVLISAQSDMEVVGEADDGRMAVSLAQELQPDIVIMDVSMPDMNGQRATELLKRLCPNIKIVALTRHTDGGYLQQLLRAGASGYVLKQSASEDLVRATHAVAAGQIYLDPAVADQVLTGSVGRQRITGSSSGRLSAREEEILRLVAWGFLSKEIAARLKISIKTVDTHKTNAMSKLAMKSRIDVVRYAIAQGWLTDT